LAGVSSIFLGTSSFLPSFARSDQASLAASKTFYSGEATFTGFASSPIEAPVCALIFLKTFGTISVDEPSGMPFSSWPTSSTSFSLRTSMNF
jgi:hypothetical protein